MDMRCTLPRSLLSELSEFVAARLGLYFPEERWGDLDRGVAAAAREFGFPDAESCARRLLSASLTRSHIEVLASQLTVGETYFFRERQSLEILEQHIVPELLRRRRDGERHLRIWSAGCCTGEEPYSVAMLLERLVPDRKAWNITVVATDINPHFLRKAARGVYGEWSFRDTPEPIRERYFRKRKDGRWELHARIRNRVAFSYLNLAEDVYPSLLNNTNAMDVILCRNVLMYFNADQAKTVCGNFFRSLVDGGWLIVSPTETSNTLFSSFSPVQFPGAVIYAKGSGTAPRALFATHEAPPLALERDAIRPAAPAIASEPTLVQAPAPGESLAPGQSDGDRAAAAARNFANRGSLAEAIDWCRKAIAADKLNPARHYLLASIRQEQGEAEAAVRSLTRALYLDSGFVLAHFAMGNIELSRGRYRDARRHFTNALATLRAHLHDEILPESDGMTAGRLTEIVTSVLASLPRAAARA